MIEIKLPKWAIGVLAFLVLFGIGAAIHNAGWSQGYMMGLLTGGAEGVNLTPYLASRAGGWHPGGFGGFFGGIFRLIFFIFLFGMLFKFFRFCRWQMEGGRGGSHGWHGGHHYGPQYGPQWQQPQQSGESGSGAAPEQGTQQTSWTHV